MRRRATSKYGAIPTMVDGIKFPSKKEARRYGELTLRQRAGEIRKLELQPQFPLYATAIPYIDPARDPLKLGIYRGDFRYEECDHANGHSGWRVIVEDVKGFKTPLYKWKKRHVEAQYGIEIREI